jgi:hypothetical protein
MGDGLPSRCAAQDLALALNDGASEGTGAPVPEAGEELAEAVEEGADVRAEDLREDQVWSA